MKNTSINSGRLSSSKRIAPLAYSLTVILAVAGSLILLPLATTLSKAMRLALNAPAFGPAIPVQSQTATFYLHGTGPVANPPTLFLNATAPTATSEKYKDSAGITRNGGNLWKEVGAWPAAPAMTFGTLTSLSDLHVWLGLKNSDDQGTYFDLRVEAYNNSTLVASGQSLCITGVTRNPTSAKEVVVDFDPFSPATFNGTSDVLNLKVLTRVGTNAAGGSCGGHNNAVGLRLYFDAVARASRFNATQGTSDTTPPLLTVEQPADNLITAATQINVTGTFSDQSQTTIVVNGVTAAVQGNSFTASVPVAEGQNTLLIAATDAAGNRTEVTRSVVRDTTPPVLSVAQPTIEFVTTANQIFVTGAFNDTTVTTIQINNVAASVQSGSFTATVSLPIEGINTLLITAIDGAGNQSEFARDVTRDTTPPVLNLENPTDQLVSAANVRVSGTVDDMTEGTITANGIPLEMQFAGIFDSEVSLQEGVQQVRVIVRDAVGNQSETTRTVTIDSTPPMISELQPAEGTMVDGATIIQGRATDATAVTVFVNGNAANVAANGTFATEEIAIAEGENLVTIIALDAVNNVSTDLLTLIGKDRTAPVDPILFPIITPTRLAFQTIEGRAEPGAQITVSGGSGTVTAQAAIGSGLFAANVDLMVGVNNLSVTARDADGNTSLHTQISIASDPNLALPPSGSPAHINISTGNTQKGLVGTELPRPLIAIVTDRNGAPIADVAVQFAVQQGGGLFAAGNSATEVRTDEHGRASVRYASGLSPGPQLIRATFTGNSLTPAIFLTEALEALPGGETSVSGVVLDQNLRALPNVLVRMGGQQGRTGTNGRFLLKNIAIGPNQLLEVIGRDQIQLPGRWPNISYDIDVLPGVDNDLGRPLFLPKVNAGIEMPLDANNLFTRDTTYELPVVGGEPPIRVTAKAGTLVQFPPDVTDRRLSVTRIATNRVPMTLEDGRATNLYISVQPSGAVFSPALEVSFPNLDRQPAGGEVLLMSFDHDAGRYVKVGTGHVSLDGKSVKSDPGNGIHVGAWHALPPDPPKPEVTVLGHIQVEGNPAFAGKDIVTVEAWAEGNRAVLLSPIDSPTLYLRATYALADNAPVLANVASTTETTTKVKARMSADRSVKDGEMAAFSATLENATATAYEWKYDIPSGAGNKPPAESTFFDPNGLPQVTVKGHWFAYPDEACKNALNSNVASLSAVYTIECKVSYSDGKQIKTKSAKGKLTVSGLVGRVKPDGVTQDAGVTNIPRITGNPAFSFDATRNLWVYSGPGTLTRTLSTAVIYVPQSSQFYDKVTQHEKKHEEQFRTGLFSDLFTLEGLIAVALPLTDPAPVTDGGEAIKGKYRVAVSQWVEDQLRTYCERYNNAEREAFDVSDQIAPKYVFQRCGRDEFRDPSICTR